MIYSLNYSFNKRQMSRSYFKNDLFYYTGTEAGSKNKKKNSKPKPKQTKQLSDSDQIIIQGQKQQFDAGQALKIQVKGENSPIDIVDEVKQILEDFQKSKKPRSNQNQVSKKRNIIFTPKSTLKSIEPKTQPDKVTVQQQFQKSRQQKQQIWKLRQDMLKVLTIDDQQPKNSEAKQTDNKNAQEENQNNKKQQKQQEESKEQKKAKTTGKKKKIKKQSNYVKLDLKRKYRDRFLGGVNKNLRMLTRNGKLKNIYKKSKMGTQFNMADGDLYNSYTISLSKALCVTVNISEDGEISEDEKPNYEIPQSFEKQDLQKLILDLFGFSSFREGQYETIKNILDKKSTLFVSETASGKSLTYLLASVILKGLSIIISPLVSLMLDQIDHLPVDLPAACISSLLNHQQKDRIVNMVKQGKIQLLYITPQSFLTDFMYHVQYFPQINFVCIDQAHSLSELSHSFRPSYLSLEDIILKYFKYKSKNPVVLCLTATANPETVESICQKLHIKQYVKSKSVINQNLFVTISRQNLTQKYRAILEYLNHPQIRRCKGILIYCRSKKIMFEVFNTLRNSSVMCFIYHSGLQQRQKVETLQKFRRGQIKIVIATVSLGMGLDFQTLECVIHINMPKSVQNYIQQIGRAGRRKKRAYCHLFLDKYDYFTERNYFLADQLQTESFKAIISILKQGEASKKRKKVDYSRQPMNNQSVNISQNQGQNLKREFLQEKQQIFQQEQEEKQANEDLKMRPSQQSHRNQERHLQKQQKSNDNSEFKRLSFCKAQYITQLSGLKQQAILNILLKIQKNLKKQVFKVLPMSYQTLKISFFKKNEQTIKQEHYFYKQLVSQCKTIKGTVYVPLIPKCNQLKLDPIALLTQVYGLSNQYCLKIELINEIFVWSHCIQQQITFARLEAPDMFNKVMTQFNMVQRTALTKFNIFYSLCFDNSSKSISNIISRNGIIPNKQPLPPKSVMQCFNQYFNQDTHVFYNQIVKQAKVKNQSQSLVTQPMQQQKNINVNHEVCIQPLSLEEHKIQSNLEAAYLPITQISQQDIAKIRQSVKVFLTHVLSNKQENKFLQSIKPYRDGRIITRVFMGVNDTKSNWKTYGEHPYWKKFEDKDYRQLLKTVRQCILDYVIKQGSQIVRLENQAKLRMGKSTKKQVVS